MGRRRNAEPVPLDMNVKHKLPVIQTIDTLDSFLLNVVGFTPELH
jgi:hypothetical protein